MPETSRLALSPLVPPPSSSRAGLTRSLAQKYHDALFAPVADPSPSTLAQAGLCVALRDLESSFSASPSTPWASISLAGFRVGGVDTFKRSIELTEPGEAGRKAQVSVSAPNGGAFDVEVVDFAGTTTSFPAAKPVSHVGDAVSISTLLGDHLSLVDVVSQAGKSAAGGEKLSLFNTGESFVGEVDVLPAAWLEELKGAGTVAVGSARAPMRTSFPLSLASRSTADVSCSFEDRSSVCQARRDCNCRNASCDGRGDEDCASFQSCRCSFSC